MATTPASQLGCNVFPVARVSPWATDNRGGAQEMEEEEENNDDKKGENAAEEEEEDDGQENVSDDNNDVVNSANIPAGLEGLSTSELQERIHTLQQYITKVAKEVTFAKLEVEMVNQFRDSSVQQVAKFEVELEEINRCTAKLKHDHALVLQVHEQRLATLEQQYRDKQRQVQTACGLEAQKLMDQLSNKIADLSHGKQMDEQLEQQKKRHELEREDLQATCALHLAKLQSALQLQHDDLQRKLDMQTGQFQADLALQVRVEVQEVEDRKNQQIEKLFADHRNALAEIKNFYEKVAKDNQEQVQSLKQEISEMKSRAKENMKKLTLLTQENEELCIPLSKKLGQRQFLIEQLRDYPACKAELKNLCALEVQLTEKVSECRASCAAMEQQLRVVQEERNELACRYHGVVSEIQKRCALKKSQAREKLLHLRVSQVSAGQQQLLEAVERANLGPQAFSAVMANIENVVGHKDAKIRDLQRQLWGGCVGP